MKVSEKPANLTASTDCHPIAALLRAKAEGKPTNNFREPNAKRASIKMYTTVLYTELSLREIPFIKLDFSDGSNYWGQMKMLQNMKDLILYHTQFTLPKFGERLFIYFLIRRKKC